MLDRTKSQIDLAALAAWLASKPASHLTHYTDPWACPIARRFTELGYRNVEAIPNLVTYDGGQTEIPSEIEFIVDAPTYGEAAARARAYEGFEG